MRARAAVAVDRRDGHDRLVTLHSDPPLTFRPTPTGVHLVGTSAGPLAGDDLRLDITVGEGANLTVRSVAATLAHPGARPAVSVLRIEAHIGAGGRLEWVPEPTVAVRGCDHETHVHVVLGDGATLVWRDEVVLGRHGEDSGSLLARLVIDREARPEAGDGWVPLLCNDRAARPLLRNDRFVRPLLRNDCAIGPRWPGSLGPAGVGAGTRAVGTAVIVGPDVAELAPPAGVLRPGARAAVLPLVDDDAALVTVVAPTAGAVTATLDAVLGDVVSRC